MAIQISNTNVILKPKINPQKTTKRCSRLIQVKYCFLKLTTNQYENQSFLIAYSKISNTDEFRSG